MENVKLEFSPDHSGLEPSIMCNVRKINRYEGGLGNRPILHYHEHFEILYGISGVATCAFGDKTNYLKAGDLAIINSMKPHDGTSYVENTEYYVIKFLPEIINPIGRGSADIHFLMPHWQKNFDTSSVIAANELEGSGVDALIHEIMYEWTHKQRGYESIMRSNINKIFIWTLRNRCTDFNTDTGIPENLYVAMRPAVDAAHRNFTDFSAEDAAKLCNLSYSYFSRNFKKAFGMSFTSYHESLRLGEAERMLLTTEKDITEIAAEVGFATTSYFIERFRTVYGVTPRTFRKSVKGSIERII